MLEKFKLIMFASKEIREWIFRFGRNKHNSYQNKKENLYKVARLLEQISQEVNSKKSISDEYLPRLNNYVSQLPREFNDSLTETEKHDFENLLKRIGEKEYEENEVFHLLYFSRKIDDLLASLKKTRVFTRRDLIPLSSGALASGVIFHQVGSKNSLPEVNWTMATFMSNESNRLILYNAPFRVSNLIKEMTQGRFNIGTESVKTLKADDMINQVHEGKVICGYSGIYHSETILKSLLFGSAIPFGLNVEEQMAWLSYKTNNRKDKNLTYVQNLYAELNKDIIPFPISCTGAQMGGWFMDPVILELSDQDVRLRFENKEELRFRIPSLGAEVFRKLGVTTRIKDQNIISAHDIKPYIEDGILDGGEWIGPSDDVTLGLHEIDVRNRGLSYYYYPGWWETSSVFNFLVNKREYNDLPDHYKAIFRAACNQTFNEILNDYNKQNRLALQVIKRANINIIPFNYQILKSAKEATDDLLMDYSSRITSFKKAYEEWKKFKTDIRQWSQLGMPTSLFETLYNDINLSEKQKEETFNLATQLYRD